MKTILLVDDDDLFADMLQKPLTHYGYGVVRASNGSEALQYYNPQTVDLVLTDLIMPDIEGLELIMALRKVNPAVRVIAMSGGGRNQPEAYLTIAKHVGAIKTLAKPFPLEDLRNALAESLGGP